MWEEQEGTGVRGLFTSLSRHAGYNMGYSASGTESALAALHGWHIV